MKGIGEGIGEGIVSYGTYKGKLLYSNLLATVIVYSLRGPSGGPNGSLCILYDSELPLSHSYRLFAPRALRGP